MGQKVAVLGAGAFGSALGEVLKENGHQVKFYDPVLEVLLEDVLAGAEVILMAAPSTAIWELTPRLPKDLPMIVATKGLLSCKEFGEFENFQIMSGPVFAKELRAHQETLLTATGKLVADLFQTPYLKFEFTDDKLGVLLCGSLKNVYAILAGIQEVEPGSKEYDQFLKEAGEEMKAVLEANGCKGKTVELSCGMGDLALTCSKGSRNFRYGLKLARNPEAKPDETVEGVSTLRRIARGELKVPPEAMMLTELIEESKGWRDEIEQK